MLFINKVYSILHFILIIKTSAVDVANLSQRKTVKCLGQVVKFQSIFQHFIIVLSLNHPVKQRHKWNCRNAQSNGTYKLSAGSHKLRLITSGHFHKYSNKKSGYVFSKHKHDYYQFWNKDSQKNSEEIHFWRFHHFCRTQKGKFINQSC